MENNQNTLVELTMISDEFMTSSERKALFDSHAGIVTIIPQINNKITEEHERVDIDLKKDIKDLFVDYFQYRHNQAPNDRILSLLKEVLAEEDEQ